MSKKIFLVDVNRCNGCHNCQIACKDEHCGTSWLPYAAEQPDTGQFWCRVKQEVHGSVPKVNMTYMPVIGSQTEAIREYAPEVLQERGDGLVVIDPEKAKGREDIAERFEGVYWNAELEIPQACTGCAHLIDDPDSPIRTPRCVDNCHVDAILFGEENELDLEGAEKLSETSLVWYKNLPKKFIAGTVFTPEDDEVVIGAKVTATGEGGTYETTTDDWGDFWLRDLADGAYKVTIAKDGKELALDVDVTEKDAGLGDIALA